jgi:filamin
VGRDDVDPAAVRAGGPGLNDVYAGVKTEFTIDTSNAGHGNLSVTVDGPSKVTMDCTEVDEGYKVRYTPLSPGEYYITVKYNAYHIAGSPFRVRCLPSSMLPGGGGSSTTTQVTTTQQQTKAMTVAGSSTTTGTTASKVTASGVGLSKGFIGKQNSFTVNCSNAGRLIQSPMHVVSHLLMMIVDDASSDQILQDNRASMPPCSAQGERVT